MDLAPLAAAHRGDRRGAERQRRRRHRGVTCRPRWLDADVDRLASTAVYGRPMTSTYVAKPFGPSTFVNSPRPSPPGPVSYTLLSSVNSRRIIRGITSLSGLLIWPIYAVVNGSLSRSRRPHVHASELLRGSAGPLPVRRIRLLSLRSRSLLTRLMRRRHP
jgi:hypothetical protein